MAALNHALRIGHENLFDWSKHARRDVDRSGSAIGPGSTAKARAARRGAGVHGRGLRSGQLEARHPGRRVRRRRSLRHVLGREDRRAVHARADPRGGRGRPLFGSARGRLPHAHADRAPASDRRLLVRARQPARSRDREPERHLLPTTSRSPMASPRRRPPATSSSAATARAASSHAPPRLPARVDRRACRPFRSRPIAQTATRSSRSSRPARARRARSTCTSRTIRRRANRA